MKKSNSVSTVRDAIGALCCLSLRSSLDATKQTLGVTLRPAAETLLERIERAFGAPLDVQRRSAASGEIWRGFVSNGVPTLEKFPQPKSPKRRLFE